MVTDTYRKDFFLPRAQAEMNFSMEPVWTDLPLLGGSITVEESDWQGSHSNPSLKKQRLYFVPKRVAKTQKGANAPRVGTSTQWPNTLVFMSPSYLAVK